MRDFYPDDMRLQNWLFDQWRGASLTFGFEEYEGPIFEFLDLYTVKSGEEIAAQLFHVRHGRSENAEFAIRPEMTPTLARMVAARANTLPRPMKWFSIPRMCRAERQQKGRLREFFQWNVDILGLDDPLADAEVIAVAVDLFRRLAVAAAEVSIRWSDRRLAAAVLAHFGIPADSLATAFQLIDRAEKLGRDEFAKSWNEKFGNAVSADTFRSFLETATLEDALNFAESAQPLTEPAGGAAQLRDAIDSFNAALNSLGIREYCEFDFRIVRGLAYYTGTIFEAYPRQFASRALLGGGRYDNLTELVGGPRVPGVGFGAGDAPIFEFLRDLKRLPALGGNIDAFVIDADEARFEDAIQVAAELRQHQIATDFSYKRQSVGKQLKQALARSARFAILVGQEFVETRQINLKELKTGAQELVSIEAAASRIRGST